MNLAIDFSDEIDKTGFSQIKARALLMAAQCAQNVSPEVTLGPNARRSIWDESCGNQSSRFDGIADLTPIPKPRVRETKCHAIYRATEEPTEDVNNEKEVFIQRRILADLNQLSVKEAQKKMHLYQKAWSEHENKVQELIAQRNAHLQAEDLVRQQMKIAEMAKMQEEYIKKQQELDALQSLRDKEFYRRHEENKKHQLEAEKIQRAKAKKQADLFQQIFDSFSSFSSKYQEILGVLQQHEELKSSVSVKLDVIKSCHEKFNGLIAKCKLDQINEDDVRSAQHLLDEVTAFSSSAKREIENIEAAKKKERELENLKKIEEDTIRKKHETESKQALHNDGTEPIDETPLLVEPSRHDVVTRSPRYMEYQILLKNQQEVEEMLAELSNDEDLKKFRIDCQRAVNIPLNAISAQSSAHITDKYKKLMSFLQNQTVIIAEKRISAASHPLGSLYSMNYLAMKTVKQGEHCVSSNPEAAYPIAAVVVALWTGLPDFGKLLLSHFYRASPYLIPAYWERQTSEDDEEYYKRLGFLYLNNEKEDMDKFLKRQSGIMRLYCAIVITSQNKSNKTKPHPLPLREAWKWLTAFISLPPKPDISATVLLEMLEITGHYMMSTYGTQFRKLLHLICISYLPLVEKVTPAGRGGPVTRLRGFLEGLISGKSIPSPKGLLPSNFW